MTSAVIQRAQILIEQRRFQDAISYILEHLASLPNNSYALYLLAFCHIQLQQIDEAEIVVNNALAIDPTRDTLFFLKARIAFMKDEYQDAIQAIKEAIAINPQEADYFAFWSQVLLSKSFYKEGLAKAEEGLALAPEHENCLNMRSNALYYLGKKDAAFSDLKDVLSRNPEDAYSHASLGWKRLEAGDHRQAVEDFRESLRLHPNQLWSKRGALQALQARYLIFRQILKYTFFMKRQGLFIQLFLIVGILVLGHLISQVFFPLYLLFAMMAVAPWLMDPLSDLFLRFHLKERPIAAEEQSGLSSLTGILFNIAITAAVGYCVTAIHPLLGLAAIIGGMMLPVINVFSTYDGRPPSTIIICYILIIAAMGITGIGITIASRDPFSICMSVIVIAAFIYQLLAKFVFSQKK
ncbi:tetratricopeptide repeat protein [Chitinophaga dinghuensis]|uniref:Tetratricopeptide repeat protein n=1 Tax=Chitinophaga dinghuensis TaxID=1539050 RepID=A0A327VLE6_9BACT|nr:tetratricopeptide repeat protein [Chitinophaga dinghuensis]RAJ75570.1 tetratricopeptide repeat protein [Chitinophaga dinghuensis]